MRYISAISMLMLCLLPLCGDTMGTQDANGCIPITLPPPHLPLMEQSREGEREGGREMGGAGGEREREGERMRGEEREREGGGGERERERERARERERERESAAVFEHSFNLAALS